MNKINFDLIKQKNVIREQKNECTRNHNNIRVSTLIRHASRISTMQTWTMIIYSFINIIQENTTKADRMYTLVDFKLVLQMVGRD